MPVCYENISSGYTSVGLQDSHRTIYRGALGDTSEGCGGLGGYILVDGNWRSNTVAISIPQRDQLVNPAIPGIVGGAAGAVTIVCVDEAKSRTRDFEGGHNGKGDAMRHCILQCCLTINSGSIAAEAIGSVYEEFWGNTERQPKE